MIPVIALLFSSCDESSVVGLDVQPEDDLLNVEIKDTATLWTRTILEDSLRTDESLIFDDNILLGKYVDPIFGTSTASFYTQLRLFANSPVFGTGATCDSVVLSLAYHPQTYGRTNMVGNRSRFPQKVNVYQVNDDIPATSSFYSDTTLSLMSTDLAGGYIFGPKPNDSITIDGARFKPLLRIPLNSLFGQTILNNQSTGSLANNTNFQSLLKGLYVTTENTSIPSGEGNIMLMKMQESVLSIYYHNDTGTGTIKRFDVSLSGVARFSHFTHNYSVITPALATQLGIAPPMQNTTTFIQAMAGLKTRVEIPYLVNWSDSGRLGINKAELVVKLDTDAMYQKDIYEAPPALVLYQINDDGTTRPVTPDYSEGSSYVGGRFDKDKNEYRFNIARYIQQVTDGQRENRPLFLQASNGSNLIFGSSAASIANRVVIGGGDPTGAFQMKLIVTYTKIH
ncbi:MAG: DUF4270 domain-containing protein [Bacteroidota bacterium]|nr:DUF4270 domain-containing protein [Bacteroidota bacterium]